MMPQHHLPADIERTSMKIIAGELAQLRYGARSMNAADILEFLPEVFRKYVE